MEQLITPTPDIPCTPGWCLQYVRQAFNLPARYDTAFDAWQGSNTRHPDRDFPAGCWVPVWFTLEAIPAGHVALLAPDGSVYSSSDNSATPHHHPSLDDLINYYAYYHLPLTYLGWTEDVAGYPVVTGAPLAAQGSTTPTPTTEDDMALSDDDRKLIQAMHDVTRTYIVDQSQAQHDVTRLYLANTGQSVADVTRQYLADRVKESADPETLAGLIPDAIAQQVIDALSKRLAPAPAK